MPEITSAEGTYGVLWQGTHIPDGTYTHAPHDGSLHNEGTSTPFLRFHCHVQSPGSWF